MNLKPLGTQILIQFLRPPEPGVDELYIPNRDIGPPRAKVLAQGSGRNALGRVIPFETKVGDIVYVSNHLTGTELKEGGETYGIITEESLLGFAVEET